MDESYLSLGPSLSYAQGEIQKISQANNAWSAAQAQKQMDFQKMMSDTAHQREVQDLKAAGLNPILSTQHSGAAVTSGAAGGTDESGTNALVNFMGNIVNSLLQLDLQRNSAAYQMALTEKSGAISELLAEINKSAALGAAGTAAAASRYSADLNYQTQQARLDWENRNATLQREHDYEKQNREFAFESAKMDRATKNEALLKYLFPSTMYEMVGAISTDIGDAKLSDDNSAYAEYRRQTKKNGRWSSPVSAKRLR